MKTIGYPFIFWILIGISCAFAQKSEKSIAMGGARGIFIHAGKDVASTYSPVNGKIGYRIERKKKLEKIWSRLIDLEGPTSENDFINRFRESANLVPDPLTENEAPISLLWEKINRWHRIDSLHMWSSVLQIRIALGVMYVDTTAEKGIQYEYRVSTLTSERNVGTVAISAPISYPEKVQFAAVKASRKTADRYKIEVRWKIGYGRSPAAFSIYRNDGPQSEFHRIMPKRFFIREKGSLSYVIQDESFLGQQNYSYYVVPHDVFGNIGSPSDTVVVASTPISSIKLPERLRAESLDTLGGLRLRWKLDEPEAIKSLLIYRSEDWDSGYHLLASVAPTDTEYIDQSVQAMKRYFYCMTMKSPFDEESGATVKILGYYRSADKPLPPQNLRGEGIAKGVRLQWDMSSEDVIGFYVFRGRGWSDSLEQISQLIPYNKKGMTYIDTSSALVGNISYIYTVKAESRSHVLGGFSEKISVRPLIPTEPLMPLKFSAELDGKYVRLHWLDMKTSDVNIAGYFVLRRESKDKELKKKEFVKIVDSLLPYTQNYYVDKSIEEGHTYEYAIQSVDYFNGKSKLSSVERVVVGIELPLAPVAVQAEVRSDGVFIRWGAVIHPNVASYKIHRSQLGGKEAVIATVKPNKLEYLDDKVKSGTLYFYTITTMWKNGRESIPSKEITIRP